MNSSDLYPSRAKTRSSMRGYHGMCGVTAPAEPGPSRRVVTSIGSASLSISSTL